MSWVWRTILESICRTDSDILNLRPNQSPLLSSLSFSRFLSVFLPSPNRRGGEGDLQKDRRQNRGKKEQKSDEHRRKSPLPHLPWQRWRESEKGTALDVACKKGQRETAYGSAWLRGYRPRLQGLFTVWMWGEDRRRRGKGDGTCRVWREGRSGREKGLIRFQGFSFCLSPLFFYITILKKKKNSR